MVRIFTTFFLMVGALVCSCNQVEENPQIQKPLAHTEWSVAGYVKSGSGEPKYSPIDYRLNFINDSTFILHLDINKVVGKYSITEEGGFQVLETKKTHSCCDGEYALQVANVIIDAQNYSRSHDGLTLVGVGEVFFKESKKTEP